MSSNVIYLIVLWISYLNPQLLLVEHLESLLLSVLVSALQTGMIDVELQCTLDTQSVTVRSRLVTVRFIQLINFLQTNLVAAFQERDQMFD